MVQTKVVEKKHILFSKLLPKYHAIYEIIWRNS